ncbi:MAG TPA: KH domain-containing protein [Candidatus Diapherotrites archaeon]|uniref:KH domain-containing protein n=1 Tax=Candidatus Iainarchaeum sp. TaxID=3101447 RepID=A0A7J4IUE7_9ARCH|nr:KH domain-containing protein [Candidatus Diapherotrites archaeon]
MADDANEKAKNAFENAMKKFQLHDVEFERAIELPNLVILLCKGKIGALIGKGGLVVGDISKEIGGKVRIVENTPNEKKMISDMVGNARLLGINEVFTPQGRAIKIKINRHDRHRLVADEKAIQGAIGELTKCEAMIEFE